MRKNAFIAINHIAALNEFRQYSIKSGDLPLTEEDFRTAFKACGIPSNHQFFTEFKKAGLLIKVEGDMWTWKNRLPIHHRTLQSIYARYQKKVNGYVTAYYARKRQAEELKEQAIKEAIILLKENGFEVLVPCKGLYKKF